MVYNLDAWNAILSHYSLQNTSVHAFQIFFYKIFKTNGGQWCLTITTCLMVPLHPLLNSGCSCRSLVSTIPLIFVIITFPGILAAAGNNVIPRRFLHSKRLPFLDRWIINLYLHSSSSQFSSYNEVTVVSKSPFKSSIVKPTPPPTCSFFIGSMATLTSACATGSSSISRFQVLYKLHSQLPYLQK